MKNISKLIAPLGLAVLTFVSCISDSETETSPECAVIAFSVADISSSVTVKKSDGTDTVVTRTIDSGDIYFNIDQNNGLIYNVDSLPVWVDLTKVVPTFSCYGYLFGQINAANNDSLYYYITSGSDSIDFSKPLNVRVVSTDGTSPKDYVINIRKSAYYSDTIVWNSYVIDTDFKFKSRALTLNSNAYMFYETPDGNSRVAISENGMAWNGKDTICVNYSSVLIYKNKFYGLDSYGYIYSSEDAQTWNKVSEKNVNMLLASDGMNLYAFDGTNIIGTSDFESWTDCGAEDLDNLPTRCMYSFSYISKTNSSMEIALMGGLSENNELNSVSWYKVTSADSFINQKWGYMYPTEENEHSFPYLEELSVVRYGSDLYAIGQNNGSYKNLYRSTDNGIGWWTLDEYPLPDNINTVEGNARMMVVGDELWIVRGTKIWKGVIR
jgi:hypothetical protein